MDEQVEEVNKYKLPEGLREAAYARIKSFDGLVGNGTLTENRIDMILEEAKKWYAPEARPPHGSQGKLRGGCGCWRCRRAGGIALPRGPRTGPARRAAVEDWLAWTDPDDGTTLTQAEVGRLVGVGQGAVSRIARG